MSNNNKLGRKRVGVGIILLAFVLTAVIYGGFLLALLIGIFIYMGMKELVKIAEAKGLNPSFHFIVVVNFILLGLISFNQREMLLGAFALISLATFIFILFRGKNASINDITFTIMAVVYGGIFPIHVVMIRNLETVDFSILGYSFPIGVGLLLLMFLVVAACDIAAFCTGMLIGKHPLWKEISPKKTIEGSVGGTIAGVLISIAIGAIIGLSIIHSILIGFLLSITGQFGDLSESMLKREVGIKDSGNVFPGHGGVLDRSDSYIFTAVTGYYYFKFFLLSDMSSVLPLSFCL